MDKINYIDWIDKVKILQKAVIKNKEDKILALKRVGAQNWPRPNCWDLVGGRVEDSDIEQWKAKSGKGDENDILINALKREIKEETSLVVQNIRVIHATSGFNDSKKLFVVAIGYLCEVSDEDAVKLSAEHTEYKWVAKNEFMGLEIGDDGGLIYSILGKC